MSCLEGLDPMQMFNPNRRNEPATPPPAPRPAGTPAAAAGAGPAAQPTAGRASLSRGVSINGSLKFRDELEIDCEVEGTIDSAGRLTVGKNAHVKGDIKTKSVVVQGMVEGNITVTERCELRAGCTLHGDIEAPRLVVDDDATFMGSAKITSKGRPSTAPSQGS